MNATLKRRRGLGTVIATLIILIASVILGAGVIFFGGSLFHSNAESEAIQVSNTHIWVSPNGTSSVAAFVVQNTGGKQLTIEKIAVRGLSVPISNWYYNNDAAIVTAANIQRELTYDGTLGTINVDGIVGEEAFAQASGPLSLDQGEVVFVYMANPASVTAMDNGLDLALNVQAGKASAVMASVRVVPG